MTSHRLILLLAVMGAMAFEYNEEFAREQAGFAFASYCAADNITEWKTGVVQEAYPYLKNIQVAENADAGTRAFVAYNSLRNAITVVFRGTDNSLNWVQDITLTKAAFSVTQCNCKVHAGFQAAYTSLYTTLEPLFIQAKFRYPTASVEVAGHSLGGAMATMFSAQLATLKTKVILTTIGSPRVGDSDFWDYFESLPITHYRIVNQKDFAPHQPIYAFGYMQVNREIWYNTESTYIVCQDVKGEDRSCSYSVKAPIYGDHYRYLGWNIDSLGC